MSPEERAEKTQALCAQLYPHIGDARVVAGYLALGDEADPLPLLERLAAEGREIALPIVISRKHPLKFVKWRAGDPLQPGQLGVLQPSPDAPELVPELFITPLTGFTRAMGRIGQGAAHYDRAFAAYPAARRIGFAWSVQEVDTLPADPWDAPLHAVATEREWIEPVSS